MHELIKGIPQVEVIADDFVMVGQKASRKLLNA